MTIRIRRGFALLLILFASAGCPSDEVPSQAEGPSPAPSEAPAPATPDTTPLPTPAPTPIQSSEDCPNEADAEREAIEAGEAGSGDIDAQGGQDPIYVAADEQGSPGCVGFVVVNTGASPLSAAVSFPDIDPGFGFPSFNSTAFINEVPGEEIVINVIAGASTRFVSVYTFDGSELLEVSYENVERDVVAGVFGFGGSIGHVEAVDCLPDGRVVVSSATPKGRRYALVRRLLDPDGSVWKAVGTERSTGSLRKVTSNPEFAGSPFLNCS